MPLNGQSIIKSKVNRFNTCSCSSNICFDKRRDVFFLEKVSVFFYITVLFWAINQCMYPPKYQRPPPPPRAQTKRFFYSKCALDIRLVSSLLCFSLVVVVVVDVVVVDVVVVDVVVVVVVVVLASFMFSFLLKRLERSDTLNVPPCPYG